MFLVESFLRKEFMKKLIKLIRKIFILCLILILMYVIYAKYIEKRDLISIFNKSFLIVMTGSMEPSIEGKELIIIDKKEKYKIGDIVTYKDSEDFIVTHRIIDITDKYFIAKGDSNNISDDKQSIDNIYGKVIFHSKTLGIFILYILKPLILLYLIYFITVEIYFIKKEQKSEEIIK